MKVAVRPAELTTTEHCFFGNGLFQEAPREIELCIKILA